LQDYRTRRAARSALLKRQMLLKWIAGFTVTIAATVVAAFVPAAAAEATFLSVTAAGTDIAYEAYVDASLDESGDAAIRVVARDQFGDREQTVFAGRSSGVFTGLKADTEYRLLIEIDSGFGWRTLARTDVSTDPGPGGAIVGYSVEETGGYQWETFQNYAVSIHVADPEGVFAEVGFRYQYLPLSQLSEPDPFGWTTVAVTSPDQIVQLPPLWKTDYRFFWILQATTVTAETVILDQRTFDTSPVFFAYLGAYDAGVDWLDVSAHVEANPRVEAVFEILVTCPQGETVARFRVEPSESEEQELPESSDTGVTRVDGLLRATEYHLSLDATYVDPTTGFSVTETIASGHAWTMPPYSGSFGWTETDQEFDFHADYVDPSGVLGPIYYHVYRWVDGIYQYHSGGEVQLTVDGDRRTAAFTVPVPGDRYRILVSLTKTPIAEIAYSSSLADIVRNPA